MWLTAPLSLPTSWLLDFCLPRRRSPAGPDDAALPSLLGGRQRLKTILALHGDREGLGGELKEDEVKASGVWLWYRTTAVDITVDNVICAPLQIRPPFGSLCSGS